MWCETWNNKDFLNWDEHPPVFERVQRVVHYNVNFVEAFNCQKNINACEIW